MSPPPAESSPSIVGRVFFNKPSGKDVFIQRVIPDPVVPDVFLACGVTLPLPESGSIIGACAFTGLFDSMDVFNERNDPSSTPAPEFPPIEGGSFPQEDDFYVHACCGQVRKILFVVHDHADKVGFAVAMIDYPLPEHGGFKGGCVNFPVLKSMEEFLEGYTPYDGPFPIPVLEKSERVTLVLNGKKIDINDQCSIC